MKNDRPSAGEEGEEKVPATLGKSPPSWPLLVLLAALIIVPVMFWQRIHFGTSLSDEEIRRRLSHLEEPREVQHACEQVSRRMQRDPQGARQFYDLLVSAADHPDEQIRYVVAWCMGEDGTRDPLFHQALLSLAGDGAPRVRYNAALALARFDDPAARGVLCEMLNPYVVLAEWEGPSTEATLVDILDKKQPVRPRMQLALVDTPGREPQVVLAPLGGRIGSLPVGRGERIVKGRPLCTIQPSYEQVYEALRALTLVGLEEDLQHVEPYSNIENSFSHAQRVRLQAQARLAAEAIQRRREPKKQPSL